MTYDQSDCSMNIQYQIMPENIKCQNFPQNQKLSGRGQIEIDQNCLGAERLRFTGYCYFCNIFEFDPKTLNSPSEMPFVHTFHYDPYGGIYLCTCKMKFEDINSAKQHLNNANEKPCKVHYPIGFFSLIPQLLK